MNYTCFNCEENIFIPEFTYDNSPEITCFNCQTPQYLNIYKPCSHCNTQFLKDMDTCPICQTERISIQLIPELNYLYISRQTEYDEAINNINEIDLLAVDTEGNSLDPFTNELFLIQIGDEHIVYVFNYDWFKRLSAEAFWKDQSKLFILHNVKYDYKVLKHSLGIELANVFDTMLAERILTCGLARHNSLKELVAKYLEFDMDKEIRNEFITMKLASFTELITKELIEYAARDVQLLPIIYRMQKLRLSNQDLTKVANLEFQVSKIVGDIELAGMYINIAEWKKIIKNNISHKAEIEKQIYQLINTSNENESLFGDNHPNLNSTKILISVFDKLRINITSTKEEDLLQIDHPLAKLLLEYRGYEKQLSSFGESFLDLVRKDTHRIHPTFQQIGADTGRFSCNNPNIQQIPATEEYRKCFIAPKGKKIISCDYSQQELRILASLSKDPKFIKFYEDGVDLHSATASLMFNIPIEKVEKDTHRKIAKTINFGLAYGQGAKKLGHTIGMEEEEAKNMINKYFAQFSYIQQWLEGAAKEAQSIGYSKTLMRRKRYYNIPDQSSSEYNETMAAIGRRGKNSPIQGSGADMIKLAMVKIDKRFKEQDIDAFITSIVHDEIVAEASNEDAELAGEIIKECMVEAGKELAPNVPIVAEVGIGDYWKH